MVSRIKSEACVFAHSDLETLLRVLWMWSHLLMIPRFGDHCIRFSCVTAFSGSGVRQKRFGVGSI
jgi:hypothetical protein